MSKQDAQRQNPVAKKAYTVSEFCEAYHISRSKFYEMRKAGHGPRIMKVGRRTLISYEAAEEWRIRMESDSRPSKSPRRTQRRDTADSMNL